MEVIQSTRFSSFCCGVYSFLHHPNLSKTEKCVIYVILLTLLSCYKLNRCYIKLINIKVLSTFWKWFLCSLRYCLKLYFSKGVYSFKLSTVLIYLKCLVLYLSININLINVIRKAMMYKVLYLWIVVFFGIFQILFFTSYSLGLVHDS